ncbi:MAG TPA: CoA transferase, partial [Acidimicrobiaceae bacterium]|nr:CoA transferase [Acidimicrobiaceae bacterium]
MWAMAGPAASRVLADYGAEIIRVESANKIDAVRTLEPFPGGEADPDKSGIYHNMNAGKRGLSLDLSKPDAIDVIWDLIDWADVVLESFSPKAMAAWGLDYAQVSQRKPEVIMASSCLMGQTGPLAMLAGFGTMAAAISGFFYPVGWTDRAPS